MREASWSSIGEVWLTCLLVGKAQQTAHNIAHPFMTHQRQPVQPFASVSGDLTNDVVKFQCNKVATGVYRFGSWRWPQVVFFMPNKGHQRTNYYEQQDNIDVVRQNIHAAQKQLCVTNPKKGLSHQLWIWVRHSSGIWTKGDKNMFKYPQNKHY